MSLNQVTLIGNLGRDVEIRHTGSGTAVCELNLAINERRKRGDKWENHTEWVRCVVFGKRAENCAQYLAKGSKVAVVGRLTTEKWEKDGVTHYTTKVVADNVQFLDSKSDGKGRSGQHDQVPSRNSLPDYEPSNTQEGLDDDIPF